MPDPKEKNAPPVAPAEPNPAPATEFDHVVVEPFYDGQRYHKPGPLGSCDCLDEAVSKGWVKQVPKK